MNADFYAVSGTSPTLDAFCTSGNSPTMGSPDFSAYLQNRIHKLPSHPVVNLSSFFAYFPGLADGEVSGTNKFHAAHMSCNRNVSETKSGFASRPLGSLNAAVSGE